VRIFLTGATGFIGGEVARRLRARGDEVRALVRTPGKAGALEALGCELLQGDLSDEGALVRACEGQDAVVHCAAVYEVGIPGSRRDELVDANVRGTERVLGAALTAGVPRAVYVSTVAVFGNTGGEVAHEDWSRTADGFTSVYEETKVCAHKRAQQIGARGLALVTVQPGVVYGPGDTSTFGDLLGQLLDGKLPALPFPGLGVSPVHRDDVAAGILLALDEGVPGQSYVLAGEPVRMRALIDELAELSGRRRPRTVPTVLLRALAPVGRFVGPALGFPPNLRELISSSDGVTFWARGDKAREELGWQSRSLREGLQELVDARQG
jgi:nucleoside-diphosphate-sugar epimerase